MSIWEEEGDELEEMEEGPNWNELFGEDIEEQEIHNEYGNGS